MTDDSDEREYWLTREHVIFLTMLAEGNVANAARHEIVDIVAAWYRGQIIPRREAPTIEMLLADDPDWPPQPSAPAAPVEIVGGASGLQRFLVRLAEENRGLDHAALKQLFDGHQVVVAVWRSPDAPGEGFLTLKGIEYLLAQAKRGAKKIRATTTAIPCNNREHAQLLQQSFEGRSDG
jgi:hypothetical protein